MNAPRQPRRDVHGIILLDKPYGVSSNAALQRVKRLFQARKAGHTGSLDPLATGLLPVCLGDATKMSGFLLDADKSYRVRIKLGIKTTTGDAEGAAVTIRPVVGIDKPRLLRALEDFTGQIEQVPPMHSAIKQNGQPLYKLAHQGVIVERQPRSVIIRKITLLQFEGDRVEVEVDCSKGTYIRVLAEDIGEALGCGAHVAELRRTRAGPFDGAQMLTLDALEECAKEGLPCLDGLLLPMDSALAHWPDVLLPDDAAYFLRQGQAVRASHAPASGWVKLYTRQRRFLGVGCMLEDGRVAPRRLVGVVDS